MWRAVLSFSVLLWCATEGQPITCRNGKGAAVDWYILYNTPKLNNKELSGLEYYYMDSTTSGWHECIDDPEGVLARTLGPVLTQSPASDLGFITYSDQPPNGQKVGQRFGHSKGVVMTDRNTGLWLLHSTPHFPCNRKEGKLWPASGVKNAQTFICVTFPYSQFKQIGQHLLYIRAYPFDDPYVPNNFHQELQDVINQADIHPNDPFLDQGLKSAAGRTFRSFAKYSTSSYNVQDIYGLIAGKLRCDLDVKTWGEVKYEESDGLEDGKSVDSVEDGERGVCLEEGRVKCMGEGSRVDSEEEEGIAGCAGEESSVDSEEEGSADRAEEGSGVDSEEEEGSAGCAGEGSSVDSEEEEGSADCAGEVSRVHRPEEGITYSSETEWKVRSVEEIKMKRGSGWVEWRKGNDHSKWCVSEDQNKQWTCVGDMNICPSQMRRPGGAICIELGGTWEKFKGFIAKKKEEALSFEGEANSASPVRQVFTSLILLPSVLLFYFF